ncbi:MAG: PD40 domain-containing protein [Candidatus Krumholzibacteriota bacterium]|nr:PD40 domain-containing protein [Candidatus Krumholzibacteriota bacterium]
MPGFASSRSALIAALITALFMTSCENKTVSRQDNPFPVLKGEYFGQIPPGSEPKVFAPGLISTGLFTRDIAMTPDGKEIYFTAVIGFYRITQILVTKNTGGVWTKPEVASFSGNPDYMDAEPAISPDGSKFLFLSTRPDSANGIEAGNQNIWMMDRIGGSWGAPYTPGPPITTEAAEFFPSMTNDGTLYFTRNEGRANYIFRSRIVDGIYTEPEKLPENINSTTQQYNAFISPDESYLIVPVAGHKDGLGGDDYFISFRNKDDIWSELINMGDKVNTPGGREHSPYVSPDGKYFFFMSERMKKAFEHPEGGMTRDLMLRMSGEPGGGTAGIYWVDASFIEELRPLP